MFDKIVYETPSEKFRRERSESIKREYISYSERIKRGDLSPNRVFSYIASCHGMTTQGVKNVLKRLGVYKNSNHPIII